ncbi:PEP-CTERM sorting domain-containing protein [Polymorphobacter arshaanensis]|uniref:PEP-CTERM sorting domain-containing protein n=2 Tax=Glacieibacterium arshaanense TaxID=2511025 RepID=A0A4Y9EP46_9SPHN|nr:PEP-CTERM sorting domain-containing protein [Polymorphobacter arshaanensis]
MNATLSGQALFDNFGEVFLNGNQVGGTITGFGSLSPFGTNSNFFVAGLNTLSFVLHNEGGPEAFQVAGLTVTAAPLAGAVPEPASWALMLVGFGMTGAAVRRRSRAMTVAN